MFKIEMKSSGSSNFASVSSHMRMTQHFLHDEVIVDGFCEFLSLIGTFGFLVISDFLIKFQLWNWLVSIVLAVVFEELESCRTA